MEQQKGKNRFKIIINFINKETKFYKFTKKEAIKKQILNKRSNSA